MLPPKKNDLDGNPVNLFSEKEIKDYYNDFIFDFNTCTELPQFLAGNPDYEFSKQTNRLTQAAMEIRKIKDKDLYDQHTDMMHDFARNPRILQNYFICKNKAFLKLCEIFEVFKFDIFEGSSISSFHLCEGPGYFIEAVHVALMRSRGKNEEMSYWKWGANTLNPYFENRSCFDKLIDDSHIRPTMDQWYFGPSDDGDIEKFTEEYLIKQKLAGTFDLVTADGSTNTQGKEGEIESIVSSLISAEVEVALKLLRRNGRLILKTYRFCAKSTRDVMNLLADNFSSIKAIKPMASRPGSSERYIVCDGFGGSMNMDISMLLQCDEFFVYKQIDRIELHLKTFIEHHRMYLKDNWNSFLKTMKDKSFTAESRYFCRELQSMFPSGSSRSSSPWMRLYGHNLIRRNNPEDLKISINRYILTADIFDPDYQKLDVEQIVARIMDQEEILTTSDIQLRTIDSLFVDPIALKQMLSHNSKIYYDLFEKVSTKNSADECDWRKNFSNSNRNYTLKLDTNVTIEHILAAISEGFDNYMESFTLTNLPQITPPLFLSRISGSMYALLYTIFDKCETRPREICWSGWKGHMTGRTLIARIRLEIAKCKPGTSIRCFVPMDIFDDFFTRICYRNVVHMTVVSNMCKEN
ncbi:Cap-specific mRNA (nucleoside-2'-O-)-methyltransferase 2 [Caenorhabditis elegans]|uniref:Cap-specific mRNA (nucleoside-2'-O-)-methyltransferase 2 n=1 Tax=Caenorhabditis elegans TaxID=6239 RepID=O76726_CAEEL|nr:Cap-specific mRNA (nucleoside-2'-O-)-methyltransferase 2 [Caenorhabditis elegans]CCD64383.2 Cap-specific mRNA (nucleoside-2'-O-)-methyltransferase 2 [Caenorhabditis elegans]|eukprot:NP_498461.3 Uncharacterized protein CELE_Y40D12A.1 [Caenorhabditis elegans]